MSIRATNDGISMSAFDAADEAKRSAPDTPTPATRAPAADSNHAGENGSKTNLWLIFAGLALAMFVFSLNQAMLSVALPTIVGELGGADQIHWVATAYMLAATGMLPAYGKLADRFGAQKMFVIATGIFLVACVAGFFIGSVNALIAVRFIQGLGGAGLVVLSQTLLALHVEPKERGKYMGMMGAVFVLSTVLGPVAGGLITEMWGWRWCFGVNIPLGLLSLALCAVFLRTPATAARADAAEQAKAVDSERVDIAGMSLLALATTAAVLVMAWGGHTYAWMSAPVIGTTVLGLVAIVALIAVERRAADPVLPMELFKQRNFVVASFMGAVLSLAMFGVTTYLPTYIQIVEQVDAAMAGFVILPMMIAVFLFSMASGFIISRTHNYRVVLGIGGLLVLVAMVLLGTKRMDQPLMYLVGVLVLLGIGLGLTVQMTVLLAQNSTEDSVMGTVTAANNLFRELGGTVGISLVGGIFTSRLVNLLETRAPEMDYASVSPAGLLRMPENLQALVRGAYSDAMLPIYLYLSPLLIAAILSILFVNEKQIKG